PRRHSHRRLHVRVRCIPLPALADSCSVFFLAPPRYLPALHSFPTRRSSDLYSTAWRPSCVRSAAWTAPRCSRRPAHRGAVHAAEDRKSTRLNSSHLGISYAVFCLKKKKNKRRRSIRSTAWMQPTAHSPTVLA